MQASDPYKSGEYIKPTPTNTPTATSTPTTTPTPLNTPTSTPTATYTLPPTAIIPWPTNTPTPQGYGYDSLPTTTPTPGPVLTSPKGISVVVDWSHLIDGSKIDYWDLGIDITGAVGDGLKSFGIPGVVVYGLSEVAELAGAGKSAYDLTQGKPGNAILNTAEPVVDGLRVIPNVGLIFNGISVAANVIPAINLNAIQIYGGR